jgi:hypothetical protein
MNFESKAVAVAKGKTANAAQKAHATESSLLTVKLVLRDSSFEAWSSKISSLIWVMSVDSWLVD